MEDPRGRRGRTLGALAASAMSLALGAALLPTESGPASAFDAVPPRTERTEWSPARYEVSAAGKPNIVVIMLDDLGAHDGRLLRALPTIDSTFVDGGTTFTDFHVQTPTCTPSRVGFLTGQHTHRHGVTRNVGSAFKPRMSIATQLHRSGYRTILAGKYLNSLPGIVPKVPPGWDEFHAIDKGYYDYLMWGNGVKRRYGSAPADYSTDVIRSKAVSAIRRTPRDKKVFAWIAPYATHGPNTPAPRHRNSASGSNAPECQSMAPWKPPNYMEKKVADKPRYVRQLPRVQLGGKSLKTTCRSLLAVDDLVRAVKAELARQGRLRNTLIILTADNGMNDGAHRLLRDKMTPYATQVPFLVSWPKVGTTPRRVTEKLANIDLAPTLCDLAGCRMGPYPNGQRSPDGRSFAPILLGTSKWLQRKSILLSFRMSGYWIPRWWGVATTRRSELASVGCTSKARKGCRWLFVQYDYGARELYDISNGPCHAWKRGDPGDPCRLHNLAGRPDYRYVQRSLEQLLRWRRR